MQATRYTHPVTIFFLTLPYGISNGFVSVTLPFLLVQHRFSVATAAAITAVGISANLWRFLWAPFTDLALTLHKWYNIGVILCAATLIALMFIPLKASSAMLLTVMIFVSQVAATLVVSPVGAFMAQTVAEDKKGRAGAGFQAGNLGGITFGGAGIWLATHFSYAIATIVLTLTIMLCMLALRFVPKTERVEHGAIGQKLRIMFRDIRAMFTSRLALFTMISLLFPIAGGAASFIWSSVGPDWHVGPDAISLSTGALSGLATIVGCAIAGPIADKLGAWWVFLGASVLMGLSTLMMIVLPLTPLPFWIGVLAYSVISGIGNTGFSAVILRAIGTELAATRYAFMSSLGNIPVVYMTALDGSLHDTYRIQGMLWGETLAGLGAAAIFAVGLKVFHILKEKAPAAEPALVAEQTMAPTPLNDTEYRR
jgi:MFS family permease